MIKQDDRTPEEKQTHRVLVIGTDSFMSGWGGAKGGTSVAAWACHPDVNPDRVENWVRNRKEMKYVRVVLETGRPYRPKSAAHFHVYVCGPDHPAARF